MNVVEIVFSPTGGTEKVADIIGKHWEENPVKIDLSNTNIDFSKCEINEPNMVIIAMPSFGGRAPAVAIERLRKIHGNGAKCKKSQRAYGLCDCFDDQKSLLCSERKRVVYVRQYN